MPSRFGRSFTFRDLRAGGTITGNLVVTGTLAVTGASTLTGNVGAGNINMAAGKVLKLDAGTTAANALQFSGSAAGTGLSAATADAVVLARSGVTFATWNANGMTHAATATFTGTLQASARLRLDAESIKTGTYGVTNTDSIVISNGTSLTHTWVATGGTNQVIFLKNLAATTATFSRNGNTFDGVAADLVLAAGEGAVVYYEATNAWVILMRGGL